jgi:predicted nucleotidyltransferase
MLDTEQLFGNRTKVRVLRYLATHAGEFTGRQLARGAGVSQPEAGRALAELSYAGIVLRRRAGRAYQFSLNPRHYAVRRIILPVFEAERKALHAMATDISRSAKEDLCTLILFGSVARGKAALQSDVDILAIAAGGKKEAVERNMEQSRRTVLDRFGRVLSPLVMDEGEFRRRFRQGDPLVRETVETGRVIYGKSIAEVLGNEREEGDTEDRAGRNSKAQGW